MYAGGMACSSSRNGQQSRPRLSANYVADPTAHNSFQWALNRVFLQVDCEDMIWDKAAQDTSVALALSSNNIGRSKQRAGSKYLFYLRKKYSCALIA